MNGMIIEQKKNKKRKKGYASPVSCELSSRWLPMQAELPNQLSKLRDDAWYTVLQRYSGTAVQRYSGTAVQVVVIPLGMYGAVSRQSQQYRH